VSVQKFFIRCTVRFVPDDLFLKAQVPLELKVKMWILITFDNEKY